MIKKKRFVTMLPDTVIKMIHELKEPLIAMYPAEVIKVCVMEKYARTFGARPIARITKGEDVCSMLGGELIDGVCNYKRYQVVGSQVEIYDAAVPAEQLTEELVSGQYLPSEKAVKAAMKKKKK